MAIGKSLRIMLLALVIPVVAIAWWLGSPLFLNRSVDEAFPRTATAAIPDNMTRDEVEQVMMGMAKVDAEVGEPMAALGVPAPLSRGRFADADNFHRGSGLATIYRLENGELVLRLEDFRVTNGPDLRVLLSRHAAPVDRADLTAAGYVELGRLKGNIGNQNYPVPDGLVVEEHHSIVIYCKPFQVVFSVAPLVAIDP